MAPEQWRSRPQSAATDQYALAVVAYELLSGYLPFENDDLEMLRLSVLQDPPVPIREMSEQVNAALLTALKKDSSERFGSCIEFIDALAGAVIAPPPHGPFPGGNHTRAADASLPVRTGGLAPTAPSDVAPLMERGHLFLEDSDWEKAIEYFNRVLDKAPKYAPAYTGLLCAELRIQSEELLGDHETPISEQKHFRNAIRFADADYQAILQGYDEKIRERIRQEERYDALVQAKNKISTLFESRCDEDSEFPCNVLATEYAYEYQNLTVQFREMDGYKDTAELANECDGRYQALKERCEERERRERERLEAEERKWQEQHDRLVQEKDMASTGSEYQRLAIQFWEMNGYKNTAELAIADVQVIDFGLASEIRSSLTRVSQMRFDTSGTRPYMAPEQWRGRPQSGQTDQYALAVVAHELLAGYLPFDGDDFEMLRAAVLQDTVEAISGMSDHINAALLTALAKDSGGRFGSCADFVSALAGGEIIKREPPTVSPHAPPKSGGHTPPGNAAPPEIVPLMDRGHLALEDSEWSKANEFFDKVLYIDAKYAPAYTGIFTGTVGMSHNGNGIPFFHRDDRLQRYHIRNAFGQKHDFCFFVPHEMESMQSHHSSGTALGHEVFVAVRIPTQPTGIDPTDSRHIIDF